jgi:hypothetical protein
MKKFLAMVSTVEGDPQYIIETSSDDHKVIIADFINNSDGGVLDYELIEITDAVNIVL